MGSTCCCTSTEELKRFDMETKDRITPGSGPSINEGFQETKLALKKANSKIEIKLLSEEKQGQGIKRTQAYETNLNENDLEKWRQDFWGKFISLFRY